MIHKKFITIPSVAVTNNLGQILLLLRGANVDYPFHWCLPGGKKEKNETNYDTAKRELKEETGLDLDTGFLEPKLIHTMPFRNYKIPIYNLRFNDTSNIVLEDKFIAYAWFNLNSKSYDNKSILMTPSARHCRKIRID